MLIETGKQWKKYSVKTWRQYLQTWKEKLSTTKTVSAVFYLNKEPKRKLKVNFNNETLPFSSEPKFETPQSNIGQVGQANPTPGVTSQKVDITRRILEELAGSGWDAGTTTLRIATLALVHSKAEHCALLPGAAVFTPFSLILSSTTPCKLCLDACMQHQWTIFLSSQTSNLLSFITKEPHCL